MFKLQQQNERATNFVTREREEKKSKRKEDKKEKKKERNLKKNTE